MEHQCYKLWPGEIEVNNDLEYQE